MAIRIASGRKTSMSKLQYRQMAISDDTEEVFIGTPSNYMKLLDEKDKKALETAIDNVEVDNSGLATKTELNTVTAALADTVKEVNGVKPTNGKITIPLPEADTSKLATKTELQAVASGSPKGTYATKAALDAAFPTGNTNIYVVTADGKWYYWNGSIWTPGGTYQATGIPEIVTTDITSIKNDLYASSRTVIKEDFSVLQNASISNVTNGFSVTRTDNTKNYGWGVIDNSYKDITFEFDGLGSWFVLGVSENGATAIGLKSGVMCRLLEFTDTSLYTQLKPTDNAITGPNSGDLIRISIENKIVIFKIKRSGQSNFVEWFTLNMNLYTGALSFINNPAFGIMDINGEKSSFKNAVLGTTSSVTESGKGLVEEFNTLKSQVEQLPTNEYFSQWKGKKWNVLGDSFTARNKYQITVQHTLGIGIVNSYGIGGTKISNTGSATNSFVDRYTQMDVSADLITVWGGVNDFMDNVPLGAISDTTKTTFRGALKILIEGLVNMFPTKKIVFITPTQMNQTHNGLTYRISMNTSGLYLKQYAEAMKEICGIYSIPCLDMYSNGGLNDVNIVPLTEDGLHPNTEGFNFMSNKIAKFLDSI